MRKTVACFSALALLAPSSALPQALPGLRYQIAPARNDGWETAPAESAGVDPARLAALTGTIRAWPELGVHAILIERGGKLIYEEYFDGLTSGGGARSAECP